MRIHDDIKDVYTYDELQILMDSKDHVVYCNMQGCFVVDGKIITVLRRLWMNRDIIINPAYTQLCEDIKNDPRFNITAEEASKRMSDALMIEKESLKNIGISVRLLTLHDKWKYWESMGMDRKMFEGTSIYAWSNLNKAQNRFKKAFIIEIILPFGRWSNKIIKAIRGTL